MLYLPTGEFKVTGGLVNLSAGENGAVVDASGEVWDGMLLFLDVDNNQTININSIDIGSTWEGTVYAPGPPFNLNLPKCSYSGNGDTVGIDLQFICYSIELIGNSNLFIDFDNTNTYEPPIYLNLVV